MVPTHDGSTSDSSAPQRTKARPATLDCPNPRWFDLQQLGPATSDGSAAGSLTASATKPRSSKPRGSSLGSVFLLSSHWVRRFFIDQSCRFFPLFIICFKGFSSINLSVFLLSSHWVRRFFMDLGGWFFLSLVRGFFNRLSLIQTPSKEVVFPPQFPRLPNRHINDYTLGGARVLEGRQL